MFLPLFLQTQELCLSYFQVVSISKYQQPNQPGGSMVVMPTQRIRRVSRLFLDLRDRKGDERSQEILLFAGANRREQFGAWGI